MQTYKFKRRFICFNILLCTILNCHAQFEHSLTFLKTIRNDDEVKKMDDSLPLFVYQGKVFQIKSECMGRNSAGGNNQRAAAGGNNDRASAGGNNQRQAAGGNNERASAGGNNQRASAGGNNDRASAGGNNQRQAAGGSNERAAAGGNNNRQEAGGAGDFSCGKDAAGNLIIYFKDIEPDKTAKIYFHQQFFTRKQGFFKLKKS